MLRDPMLGIGGFCLGWVWLGLGLLRSRLGVTNLVFAAQDLPLGFGIAFVRLQKRILVYLWVGFGCEERSLVCRAIASKILAGFSRSILWSLAKPIAASGG